MEKKFNAQMQKNTIEIGMQHDKAVKNKGTNTKQSKDQRKKNKKKRQSDKKQQVHKLREEQVMRLEEKKNQIQTIDINETQRLLDALILGEIVGRPRCKMRLERKRKYNH